jgi:hypothetical protein
MLILDDAAGHQQVEPLLPASPGCLVLVTSRRRLTALASTTTLSLYTLAPDEAVALFARLSERTITSADTVHVAEIVRLAGYLPLAIALVAGRLRHHRAWSIADLAEDLSSTRGRLLEIRAEDIEVAAAFDLSFRDLPADEQRFFCYLGMHPGPELDMHGAAALANVPVSRPANTSTRSTTTTCSTSPRRAGTACPTWSATTSGCASGRSSPTSGARR